jgi:hypothetical protein
VERLQTAREDLARGWAAL